MPFEALSYAAQLEFENVPPEWSPLVFAFDPDLPLFPLMYFHVLASDLNGRPAHRDRAFGYIRSVQIDVNSRVLTAQVICNKDLTAESNSVRFLPGVTEEVAHRLGLLDRVTISDVTTLFPQNSPYSEKIAVLEEIWRHVVDRGYGGELPFGREWDRVLGLARFYASWYPPSGGRKAEFIQTHYFSTHFGEPIQCSAGVPAVDFYLLPTWQELTDLSNPLALFPRYRDIVEAAIEMCELPQFSAFDLANWSYTGFRLPAGRQRLDRELYMGTIVANVGTQNRTSLVECFNAFSKGAARSVMFLMFLNDLRQINSTNATPGGAARPRINPAQLTAADAADMFVNLGHHQSKKVIAIYAQQCHSNHHCLPVDTWIAAFLNYPLAVAEYNRKSGEPRGTNANWTAISSFIASANQLGKVERLLWETAQARKIHSTICNDALWCIKESGDYRARGANPLACKACDSVIRTVCSAYLAIQDALVVFNGSADAAFNISTSAANNSVLGQRFTRCTDATGILLDEDTPTDSAGSFPVLYPGQGHVNGAPMTVGDFISRY